MDRPNESPIRSDESSKRERLSATNQTPPELHIQIKLDPPKITALPPTVTTLVSPNSATVHIVGTAHVSRASVDEVREVIRFTRPNSVLLELCASRVSILLSPQFEDKPPPSESNTTSQSQQPDQAQGQPSVAQQNPIPPVSMLQVLQSAKRDGIFAALLSYLYSNVRAKLKVLPGAEFRAAFEEAKKIPGCKIILGDRPIDITLKRTWANLTLWEKIKLVYTLIRESAIDITEEDIERVKDTDLFTAMLGELSKQYPGIANPLIYERDLFLTCRVRECPGPVVVAVVGLGHVEGIKKSWSKEIDSKSLLTVPPPSWWTPKRIALLFASSAVGLIAGFVYLLMR